MAQAVKTLMRRLAATGISVAAMLFANAALADHDEAYRLRQSGEILPLSELVQRAQEIHPGQLLETELKQRRGRYIYEIEIRGEDNNYYELYFDAATGELLRQEQEHGE